MRIHIFGASGSGVTTLGNALASKLNIAYFDSDTYFWEKTEMPFTLKRNPIDRNNLIRNELNKSNNWIFGGSSISWGNDVFPAFDLIVFLWVPPAIRMERLKQRELNRYGNIIFTDPQRNKLYNEFINWATNYDIDTGVVNRTLKAHENWLEKITVPILQIRGNDNTEKRIELIINYCEQLKINVD